MKNIFFIAILIINFMGCSKANDEYALTSATKDLESKTRKVRSQMSSVKSQIASVTKDIHRINMQIHKAQRRLNTMDRSIPETHAKVIAIRREIKKHEQDKREFEKLFNQFQRSKDHYKSFISELLKEIQTLENKLSIKKMEMESTKELEQEIKECITLFENIKGLKNNIETLNKQAQEIHLQWVDEFNLLVEKRALTFQEIVDLPSFKEEFKNILDFKDEIPSMGSVIKSEKDLLKNIDLLLKNIKGLQTKIRNLSSKRGASVYRSKKDHNTLLEDLERLDSKLDAYHQMTSKIISYVSQLKNKRQYLIKTIPTIWERLSKARLFSTNIEKGSDIINETNRVFKDQKVYSEVKWSLERKNRNYTKKLRKLYCPRHARKEVLAAQNYILHFEKNISSWPISDAVKAVIEPVVRDYKGIFERALTQTQMSIKKDHINIKERKRHTKVFLKRFEKKLTHQCLSLGRKILSTEGSNFKIESDFINFRTKCL